MLFFGMASDDGGNSVKNWWSGGALRRRTTSFLFIESHIPWVEPSLRDKTSEECDIVGV